MKGNATNLKEKMELLLTVKSVQELSDDFGISRQAMYKRLRSLGVDYKGIRKTYDSFKSFEERADELLRGK